MNIPYLAIAFILGMLVTGIVLLHFTDIKYNKVVNECNKRIDYLKENNEKSYI